MCHDETCSVQILWWWRARILKCVRTLNYHVIMWVYCDCSIRERWCVKKDGSPLCLLKSDWVMPLSTLLKVVILNSIRQLYMWPQLFSQPTFTAVFNILSDNNWSTTIASGIGSCLVKLLIFTVSFNMSKSIIIALFRAQNNDWSLASIWPVQYII